MNMDKKSFEVYLQKNPRIKMRVIPGHFTTSRSHITHYLDLSELKSNAYVARDVAKELAVPYLSTNLVETIVCLERTAVIGAYLAEELFQAGVSVMNTGGEIIVCTPLRNNLGALSFHSSMIPRILNRNVLLLTATISSGRSLDSALDCLAYYGSRVVGISSLFTMPQAQEEHSINTLFTSDDIPGYTVYRARNCDMCKAGLKLDALISNEGYTRI